MEKCPRSMNHRPDDFSAADCIAAGECGCRARSSLITDDIIEKAVRAYREYDGFHRDCIGAALEAVLPDLIEECAKGMLKYPGGAVLADMVRASK